MKTMRKIFLILSALCPCAICFGQVTIEECYLLARENYPLVRQYELIRQSEGYDVGNASKSWLPQFSLSGRATWQSEVTRIPIDLPGYDIPALSKDQYQILAEVSQVIWDGGAAKASKASARAEGEASRAQYEVDMYALRQRIDDLYFGVLLLDEQLRLNALFLEDLRINYDRVSSYLANGVANQSDLDAVRAEQLAARQNRIRLEAGRSAYVQMLSAFTGLAMDEGTELLRPDLSIWPSTENNRPEMALFDALEQQVQARKMAVDAANMPYLGLFVQGGYGRPGLDMLKDRFGFFAMGGVRLSWTFGNFYTRRNNLRKIETGIRQVGVQRETFLFNSGLQRARFEAEYDKYSRLLADDDEIIRTRGNIVTASEAKFANGTISSSDLVRDMLSHQNSQINKAVHEIELLQTLYGIKNLINN